MVALRKSIHYVYDPATQRHTETWTGTSYANAVTDIQYGYNDLGELASVTVLKENGQTPAAVQSSTQYNAAGGKSTTTLPNTVYTYDAGGRLTSTFNSATGITTSYTYKPNTNDISQETVSASSGASVATYSYSYRADGLKTGETDTAYNSDGTVNDTRTLSWQYDGLDRVTQETSSDTAGTAALNYTDSYQYDLNSNRTTETIENGSGTVTDTITSTYNANGELTQAVDANTGTTVYTYDNNGSQIETQHTPSGGTSPDTTTTNEYDLQGQMAGTQTTNSTGTTKATYQYDDSGNRIVETNTNTAGTTTTTYYLVDTQNPNGYPQPIEQAATPGSPQITYVWGKTLISQTYATGATIPGVGTATSPTTYYTLTDAHGSTRIVTNANDAIVASYNYDAFGNALGFNASTALTSYLYSSMPFDPASNNYYDDARFYTPGTGLFDQRDYGYSGSLANPMADLPYTFTGGDPVNMLDLNGHDFTVADITVSFAINSLLTAGFDVVGNEAFGENKSLETIIAESTVGGLLGVIGGPMIAGKFADSVVPELVKFLPDVGRMEKYVQFAARAFSLGVFRAVYNTTALYIVYFFEHPDHPLTFDQTKGLFLASLITTGPLGALENSELGPDIQAALAKIGANPTGALGAIETIGLAVPRMLANVNISGIAGDAILAFADEFVKFFSEQSGIGH